MSKVYDLKLSASAEDDLAGIYEYGFQTWGEQKADQYYDDLIGHLHQLCSNPFLYQAVEDIRPGYRRSVFRHLAIYFRVQGDEIEVMALIGNQDAMRRL